MSQAEVEQNYFFSLVTRKSFQKIKGIFRVSLDNENCIMGKMGPKIP